MPSTRSGSSGTLLTLDRGIRVLEEIARGNGLGTARSIGATLGINQGTVYQILRTLQDSGYVHRQPGGRYQLGARIAYLVDGYQIQAAPPQVIIDFLHTLHHAIDETVYAALALVRRSRSWPPTRAPSACGSAASRWVTRRRPTQRRRARRSWRSAIPRRSPTTSTTTNSSR